MVYPDDALIHFSGIFFPHRTPELVTFHRFTEEVLKDPDTFFNTEPAHTTTGISIYFRTASKQVGVNLQTIAAGRHNGIDITIDQDGRRTGYVHDLTFTITSQNPGNPVLYRIILPSMDNVGLAGLELDADANLEPTNLPARPVYVAVGDSITHGAGQGSATYKTYPFLLAEQAGWELYNIAVGGARVSPPLAKMLCAKPIDVMTILWGVNDWSADDLPRFSRAYRRFLKAVRKHHTDTLIYCITPLFTVREGRRPELKYALEQYRQAIRQAVTDRQKQGDPSTFIIEGKKLTSGADALVDEVHLNVKGAGQVADALLEQMDKAIVSADTGRDRESTTAVE